MSLFIDLEELSEAHTDDALEYIFKAISKGDDILFDNHPSPFVRRIIDLFTERGLLRLDTIRKQLEVWNNRPGTKPSIPLFRPDGMMLRWTPEELELVRIYLTALPPSQFTLEDHMLLVEYLIQRYLPAQEMRTEAQWLATKAVMMGRVQANIDAASIEARDESVQNEDQLQEGELPESVGDIDETTDTDEVADTDDVDDEVKPIEPTPAQIDGVIKELPSTPAEAVAKFDFTPEQKSALEFANERAAANVQKITDDTRNRLRKVIADHVHKEAIGDKYPGSSLQTKLFDQFGTLNRDMRRIAVTEAGEAQTQGLVASVRPGTFLKRIEQYKGACKFCRQIDGRVVEVVSARKKVKNGATQIWPGKDNIGRSMAAKRRVGGLLIDREPSEIWWIPAGLVHPNCRGRWVPVTGERPGDDPEFAKRLKEILSNPKVS